MLTEEKTEKGVILVFDPKKEFKESLVGIFFILILMNVVFSVLANTKLRNYTFIFSFSIFVFLLVLIYSYFSYLKTFFLFSRDRVIITQKSYLYKKTFDIEYLEIKQLSALCRRGKGYSHYI